MSISGSQNSISKSICDYIKIVKFKKNIGTNVQYKYIKIKKNWWLYINVSMIAYTHRCV